MLAQGLAFVKGNLGLVMTVLTELLRLLISSGSGMINFLFSLVVYFTALFYLLNSPSPFYKPIEVSSIVFVYLKFTQTRGCVAR